MKKVCLFLLIALIIPASVRAQNLSGRKKEKILEEVEIAFQDGLRTGENLDADKLARSIDDSPDAGHIVNGVFYSSFEPVAQNVRNGMQRLNRLQYEINNKKITVLSKNTAIVAVSGQSSSESTSGQTFKTSFAWTFIYRKTGDQWKVIHSHQSTVR